jgi:aspartate aminotransferase-like enzyme
MSLRPASSAIAQEVSSFIEVCVHTLLSTRSVYPAGLFESRRAFGLPSVASRHPSLNAYVHALAESVQTWLVQGEMQRIVIVLLDPPRSKTNPTAVARLLERFVFEVSGGKGADSGG